MSDGLHAPDATELPALAEFIEPAPARRIGRPRLAWAVILALTALITWGQTTRSRKDPDEQQLAGDTKSFVFDLQARYTIGAVNSGLPIKESERRQFFDQLQSMSAGGNHLRLVVAAGELVGPKQALTEIAKLPDELRASPEAQALKRLYESYAAAQAAQSQPEAERSAGDQAAIETLAAPPISPVERAALVKRLGWFGLLATVPPGTPATQERAAALAPAIRAFGLVFGALGLGCVAGLLGFAMLIALVAFAAYGSLRGLQVGSPFGGVYAETFAAWMAIFLGLGFLSHLNDEIALPVRFSIPLVGSLVALGWPVLRGVPWSTVRRDIGWLRGRAGFGEPIVGLGCYLMGIPLLFAGILVTLLLIKLRGAGTAAGPPLPSHPIVELVADGDWLWRLLLLIDAAVLAPIVEETMFRGVLYRHLREASARWSRWLSVLASATVTSFLFAIIHPQGWMAVPALMALAYTFTIAREWRESLIPCMVAHGVQNGLVFAVLMSVM